MKERLLILGAGGHARAIVALARRMGQWDLVGVLDNCPANGSEMIDAVPVLGPFEVAARFQAEGVRHAALAVGDNDERSAIFARFQAAGWNFPPLRHPSAIVEDNVRIGAGSVIGAGAIVGAQVSIGAAAIVNTGAILDHETVLGDAAHIAPGGRVAGRVRIGERAMLGIGSVVRDGISIGARTVVGAGSVVVDNLPPGVVAYGVPARVMRPRDS